MTSPLGFGGGEWFAVLAMLDYGEHPLPAARAGRRQRTPAAPRRPRVTGWALRCARAGAKGYQRLAARVSATVIVYIIVGLALVGGVSWLCIQMAGHAAGGAAVLGAIVLAEAISGVMVVLAMLLGKGRKD